MLELPPGITRTSLLKEAEFYGLQKIVDHITHVAEGEKKKKEPAKKRRALWIMIEAYGVTYMYVMYCGYAMPYLG